jgi:TolB-like protein/Flp pilus assembly protein TadD
VLPFANMSSDPDNEYFSDGISEELLNLLVQVDGLRVPSRTSSFAFKGMNMDIKEIAQQLAVEHVLEGSVRKAGNQVRITAQLIDVRTDTHLWSNTYDRELENIFVIQDEIATEIIRELKIALGTSGLLSREASRPTENMQAYQDYLRGRHLFIQRGTPSLKASIEAMQSAVNRDPEFTEAWAGLSMSAAVIASWDQDNKEEYFQIALEAGNHALMLDKNSATALAGLGVLAFNKGNWGKAIELTKRAAVLSKDSNHIYLHAFVLQGAGYIDEALEYLQAAEVADPVYPQLQGYLGINAMFRDDIANARLHFQRAIDGGNPIGVNGMFWLHLSEGDPQSAIPYLQEFATGQSNSPYKLSVDAITAALNDPSLRQEGIKAALSAGNLVALSYFSAEPEILEYLNTRLAEGNLLSIVVGFSNFLWAPEYSNLRKTPEFKQILHDNGLVALWQSHGWPDLCHPLGDDDFECE